MGIRDSRLSVAQSRISVEKLEILFPFLKFELIELKTPGDRDKVSDLRTSPSDFFTRDLDATVIASDLDCALHSAKDLPDSLPSGLDMFYLPWNEDPRDALVFPESAVDEGVPKTGDSSPRIGISSDRRAEFCRGRFPNAAILPIRGNIEQRLRLLDDGEYDLLVMAAAGLKRLGLEHRISEYVPLEELTPPAGQGYLAMTFKKDDPLFRGLRVFFVKPVVFAGSGPGDPELATLAAVDALKQAEVCLYDSLAPEKLLDYLPDGAERIYVGKRVGAHSARQPDISDMLVRHARMGRSVVRLKGGDPCVFGRLAEELEALDEFGLPFRIAPGISSFQAAAAVSGLLPTRRGVSRGFTILTPRKAGSAEFAEFSDRELNDLTTVFFMGMTMLAEIADFLLKAGRPRETPAAVILAAGTVDERVVTGDIANIAEKHAAADSGALPGLLFVGAAVDSKHLLRKGSEAKRRVLATCSETLQSKITRELRDLNFIPVSLPLVELAPIDDFLISQPEESPEALWYLFTSPSAARIFMREFLNRKLDIRTLPKIMVCGPGTFREFRGFGITPDLSVRKNYGTKGILESAAAALVPGVHVVRFRSDAADDDLSRELRGLGCGVEDIVMYRNNPLRHERCPEFAAAVFASASAVRSFVLNFGPDALRGAKIAVIGEPTENAVKEVLDPDCHHSIVKPERATIEDLCFALASSFFEDQLDN